ncbi:MAG: hypothetical protein LBK66_09620, partial [Spirochaetaceae bacterium]|nr:hypothetical protein [Spirochaetaceae bacterium]
RFAEAQIRRSSDSQKLRFAEAQIRRSSDSQKLRFAEAQIRGSSDSQQPINRGFCGKFTAGEQQNLQASRMLEFKTAGQTKFVFQISFKFVKGSENRDMLHRRLPLL